MNYAVTLWHDPGALDALRVEWHALLARSATASIYLTPEWLEVYWDQLGTGKELWLVTVRQPSGELAGLALLVRTWRSPLPIRALRWIGWRQIEFLGDAAAADHLDFLSASGHEQAVVRAVLEALWAHRFRWDVLQFGGIPAGSPSLAALEAQGGPWECLPPQVCPRIVLDEDSEAFRRRLSRGKRKEQRRYLRQLDADFPQEWAWRLVDSAEEVETTLAALITFHQAKWEALDHRGGFADPAVAALHHRVAQRFFRLGWLRLLRLEFRGELVAVLYTLRYQDRIYDYASGYNAAFARYSPGQVLTWFSIEHAFLTGGRVYDFLRGEEPYKFRWGAEAALDMTLRRVCSPQARLVLGGYRGLYAVWRQIKRALPPNLRSRLGLALRRAQ